VPRAFRTQLTVGAACLLALFLAAVFFAARETFKEQLLALQEQSRVTAQSLMAAAEAGHLDREKIADAILRLPVPADGVVAVLDVPTGTVVASRGDAAAVSTLRIEELNAPVSRLDGDGVRRSYGSAFTTDGLCRVVVGLPRRMAWERTQPVYRRNAINAGAWYVLSIVALYFFLARWVRSVGQLEAMAVRVSAGDLRTPPSQPMPTSELEQMQQTMVDMITRVRELQLQVVRQERLAAIGVLVSGVAHEINNPLQSILGFTEVLEARTDLPPGVHADLAMIHTESARAGSIIRNLSRFTRQQPLDPSPYKLTDLVAWVAELRQRRLAEEDIELVIEDRATSSVNVVSSEIQQVALNFVINAEYAMLNAAPAERRMTIRTRDVASAGRLGSSAFVRFEVEDSGAGVRPGDEAKLFQPFFTTKPVGDGTGLGLSVSYGIIQSYGGEIGYAQSATGGAIFYFELPAISPSGRAPLRQGF
jgi:signal transduction histidine kinase